MKIKTLVSVIGIMTVLGSIQCIAKPSRPSKNGLSGTNNAWAMSEPTVQSIYQNLAKHSGMENQSAVLNTETCKLVRNHLAELLSQRNVICKLTLKPNGRIMEILLSKSSGSEDIDKKALELIRTAGPFKSNKFPEPLTYEIELPAFKVKPQLL